jgi:hypothetical protein
VIPHNSLGSGDLIEGKFHVMKLHVGDAGFGEERKPLEDGEIWAGGTSKGITAGTKIPNASTNFSDPGFLKHGGFHEKTLFGFSGRKSRICHPGEIEMHFCI